MLVETDRIRLEREKRAWSQDHLAQVSGLGLRTVQRIETSGTASLDSVTALASVFEVGVQELTKQPNLKTRKGPILVFGSGLFLALAVFLYGNAIAKDALQLNYVYEKIAADDESKAESQFLLHFEETATADLKGKFQIVFRGEENNGLVNLEVAVYEYTDDEQTSLVGRGISSVRFGEVARYVWEKSIGPDYSLTVTPTRSTIED